MAKILWVNPLVTDDSFDIPLKESLEQIKQPGNEVEVVSVKKGPRHVEYRYYEALVLAESLHIIKQAEKDGFDAAVMGCFYDPGLHDAREIVEDMVITAPAETCMHLAATMAHKFSIIVGRNKWIPQMMDNVILNGMERKLASFKSLGLGVLDFHADEQKTMKLIKEKAKEAVVEDGAEALILGCTFQFGFYKEIQDYVKVPVLDAIIAPFKYAEFLVELKNKFGWTYSQIGGYETPPISEIKQWNLEEDFNIKGLWE